MSGLKRGLLAMYDCVSECVLTVDSGIMSGPRSGLGGKQPHLWPADASDGIVRKRKKTPRYSIRVEYSSNNNRNKLGRTDSMMTDEGGFDLKLPPNRFRTRSVAIVAGYCPERLYSNMPPGAFVVESGVYKVGADRDYVKSEPIYWKQVVYGNGSEGSGTYPRNAVTKDKDTHHILHEPRLIPDKNLELKHADPSGARLRASSPLDQERPYMEFLSPRGNYSDISSVPHPSSADRSIPSTLLTNPQSSLSSPNFSLEQTQSSSRTRSSRFPSLRTIPEDSRVSVQADIHASDYSNLTEYTTGGQTQPQQTTPVSSRGQLSSAEKEALAHIYRQNISYLGHYPFIAPVHRAISPSKQYPAPSYNQQASHIAPPRIPDIGLVDVDPREVDIYQRIAQIDPETRASNQRPLATSSPPHKRKIEDTEHEGPRSVQKPRFPTPPGPPLGPPQASQQISTTRRSADSTSPTHTRVVTFDTLNLSQNRQAATAAPQVAPTARKSSRSGVLRHRDRRTDSDTEYDGVPGEQKQKRKDIDSVSVVSEGLDAEVTAITSSSSPGSSGSNTLQPITKSQTISNLAEADRSSSSGIASKNTSQNQTSSSHSTSAGSASLHQSSLSPENISNTVILTDKFSKKPIHSLSGKLQRLEDSMQQVLYENWPPRPHQYVPTNMTQQYFAYDVSQTVPHVTSGIPPFTTHSLTAAGATAMYPSRTGISSPDTSIESPLSRSSRPNSSQSAPLDRSVDRHYEWDKATADDSSLPSLPPEWSMRRSPAYNPRRDRDIGHMVTQSNRERVFSDSEIYSNVFPRRRLQLDVEARVRAMKKEFNEFRKTQNVSPNDSDRLESLI